MAKVVLGFVGELSSGKGTSVSYLKEKYGASTYSFSTMLRDILDRIYVEQTRDNLIDLSVFLRRHADIEYLKKLPNFVLVEISADQETRFDRLKKRNQNVDDQSKTWEQFLADAEKPTEISIREVAKAATKHVDNNGTIEQLKIQLDNLVI